MFWESFLITFSLVFLAELGDKTQLTTMLMAAQKGSFYGVFLGSASALLLSSLIAVILGDLLTKLLPPAVIRMGAGIGFLIIGAALLFFNK